MTGERRKKIQSVILSAIMVLSVVAMSATIFAGSAAAIEDGSGQIIADPATEEVTSTHTVNLTVADSGIAVDNNNNIQAFRIDYSNDTNIGDNDNDIDVTNVDVDSLTLYVVDPDGADDQLTTLNGGDTDFDVLTNSNGDIEVEVETTLDDTLSGDEEIFIEVADIVNPSADNSPYSDVQVSVGTSSGLTGNDDVAASQHSDSENVELVIGDGPIEANIGETDLFYNTFDKAVADATTSEDTITVVEDLDQTGTNPTLATATVAANDVIISGQNSPTIDVSGSGVNPVLDLGGNHNITVQNLTFEGDGDSVRAVLEDAGTRNTTISGNTFANFTQAGTVDITPASTNDDVDELAISGNTFSGDESGAIAVDTNALADDDGDKVVVSNNVIGLASNDGIGIDIDDSGGGSASIAVNLTDNEIDGNDNTATGIQLAANNAVDGTVDIEGGSIDALQTAVDLSSGNAIGDFLNVSSIDITGVTQDGLLLTGSPGATVNVDGLTIDSSSGSTGLHLADSTSDITVTDSTINATSVGIQFDDYGVATVSNTEVDHSGGTQAIYVKQPSANAEVYINESTSIDQSATDGIEIDLADTTDNRLVDIDGVTINGSGGAGVKVTDLDDNGIASNVNITSSTLSHNGIGIEVVDISKVSELNAHFNSINQNTEGIKVPSDLSVDDNMVINATFNDFVESGNNGLNVAGQGANGDRVNAKYSYWGSDAGPNSAGGDSVTDPNGDATTEPFLLESAVDNYDDSNLGGTNVLRFGHNVEVTNNKGAVSFPTTANRTAGASIEGDTSNVMVYKLVDGQFIDAGDQVPDTMEGHVIDLTESSRTSAWVTISYSDDVQDGLGGVTYEQGQNLVGPPTQGAANAGTVFGLSGDYVISPFLSNTDDKFEPNTPLDRSKSGTVSDDVSPFDAYIIEVPDADDDLVDRFRGGNVPGGTDASEVEALLTN